MIVIGISINGELVINSLQINLILSFIVDFDCR
jgi:hypothetical protein